MVKENVLSRRQDLMARAVCIPVAAFIASHVVFTKIFPWQVGYSFPWVYFFTVATVMFSCWEINLRLFWWLDNSLPFYVQPLKRIVRQFAYNGSATLLTFLLIFPLAQWIYVGRWPSFSLLLTGAIVCATIAVLVNGAYIALYLLRTIHWQTTNLFPRQKEEKSLSKQPFVSSTSLIRVAVPQGHLVLKSEEIAYFYSSGGMVLLVKTDGSKHTTDYSSLAQLTEQLGINKAFFSISRQFVVSPNAVRVVREETNRKLVVSLVPALRQLESTEDVIVSRYRSGEFKKWIENALPT